MNRDYEGDVSEYGVSVKVINLQPVAIKAYTKNTPIAAPDVLTDEEAILTIDQAQYFNFSVDDIDQAQTRPKLMGEATRLAGWGLRDTSDAFLSAGMTAAASALAGSPYTITNPEDAYDALVDLSVFLNTKNVPTVDRWAIVPPEFTGYLRKDQRFTHSTGQGDAILANGVVGRAAGFTISESNNTGAKTVVGGHSIAYSFVEQLLRVEPYRPDNMFADAVKGLYVYGGKAFYPDALAKFVYA